MTSRVEDRLVSIYTFKNVVELAKLREVLEDNGIQIMIQSFDDTAYNGIYIPQKGVAKLWVYQKDANRARKLIKEHLSPEEL